VTLFEFRRITHPQTSCLQQPVREESAVNILYAIAAVLVAAWVFSFVVYKVSSGLIHLLLAVALVVVVARFFTGRKA
jgi:hypothetical protein